MFARAVRSGRENNTYMKLLAQLDVYIYVVKDDINLFKGFIHNKDLDYIDAKYLKAFIHFLTYKYII